MQEFSESDEELKSLITSIDKKLKNKDSFYLDVEEINIVVDYYVEKGFVKKAISVLKVGLSLHPNSTEIWMQMSQVYCVNGEYATALKYYKDLLDMGYTGIRQEFVATNIETGKTIAFGLPLLQMVDVSSESIQVVILAPTRELGKQIHSNLIEFGKDISGNPVVADLAKMPHLLVAGATGSGKSVCVNSIIVSLLLRATPDELRLILIDPKRIELAGYEGIPHLIQNVVTEPEHVMITLNWAVSEMDRRYKLLQIYGVRNLEDYNKKIKAMLKANPEIEDKEPVKSLFLTVP